MKKTSFQIATILFSLLLLVGSWFWVLYREENRRLAKATEEQSAYLAQLRATDQERKVYFEGIAETRRQQQEAMTQAKDQYEALLKTQAEQVQAQAQTTTQVVSKPVTKQTTVKVAKPKSTRKSKTS